MTDSLFLAWRSLTHYWLRNGLLVGALSVAMFVPAAVFVVVQRAATSLEQRSATTPMLLGALGSVTDLTLRSLYFDGQPLNPIQMSDLDSIRTSAEVIPLHLRFRAREHPVIGTDPSYFAHRQLTIATGQTWQRLGDCVLGSEVARRLHLKTGDSLTTESDVVIGLNSAYPLKMRITGVMAPSAGPDDFAVFVSLKTTWVIEGIGHGHQPSTSHQEGPVAQTFNEVTVENEASFHFHGESSEFPISAAILLPNDQRAQTLLVGRYERNERLQLAEPPRVMPRLLGSILKLRWFVVLGAALIGVATLALVVLVFLLSFRLRNSEFNTMRKIGASRRRIAGMLGWECLAVVSLSVLLAGLLTAFASRFDMALLRNLM